MTKMPHLPPAGSEPQSMYWAALNHLRSVRRGIEDTVFYTYDAGGQRTRKVRVHGTSREERIYFGAFELYREYTSAGLQVERESLSVMDGTRRIALVDTRTLSEGMPVATPTPIIRYQLDNHLGSACVETNELAFRQLKSQYRMEQMSSSKAHIVEALLLATFIAFMVSRGAAGTKLSQSPAPPAPPTARRTLGGPLPRGRP